MHRLANRAATASGGYKKLSQADSDEEQNLITEDESACKTCCSNWPPDVEGDNFAMAVGAVIILNAAVLGLETDLGQEMFVPCEHFFGVFFTCEMCLRLCQIGVKEYFSKFSNIFDCMLVCTGGFDLWVSPWLAPAHGKHRGSTAKLLKLLRMFRVLRIVRLFKMFKQLQIILEAFFKALNTVCWVGLLTLILNYVCAVFLTQTVGHSYEQWGEDADKIYLWFGTIGHSMRTLFIILTLAEWDEISLVVSEQIHGLIVFSFAMAYITITAFTMVSLITGIISEELVGSQREDEETKIAMVEKEKNELAIHVRNLLETCDDDNSGSLSSTEVERALENPELRLITRLRALDIDMDMQDFKDLIAKLKLACKSDDVPIDDLVNALKHLSGQASARSIWDLKLAIKEVGSTANEMQGQLQKIAKCSDFAKQQPQQPQPSDDAKNMLRQVEEKIESSASHINDKFDRLIYRTAQVLDNNEKLQSLLMKIGTAVPNKSMNEPTVSSINGKREDACMDVHSRRLQELDAKLQSSASGIDNSLSIFLDRLSHMLNSRESMEAGPKPFLGPCADKPGNMERLGLKIDALERHLQRHEESNQKGSLELSEKLSQLMDRTTQMLDLQAKQQNELWSLSGVFTDMAMAEAVMSTIADKSAGDTAQAG